MARNNQRGKNNNNPEGRNQYSSSMGDIARDRPFTTAAAAAAAVGAGVFLWSRRNQISEQLSTISDQIGEWSSGRAQEFELADGPSDFETASGKFSSEQFGSEAPSRKSGSKSGKAAGLNEFGGGNAPLGAHSGGATAAGNIGRSKV